MLFLNFISILLLYILIIKSNDLKNDINKLSLCFVLKKMEENFSIDVQVELICLS